MSNTLRTPSLGIKPRVVVETPNQLAGLLTGTELADMTGLNQSGGSARRTKSGGGGGGGGGAAAAAPAINYTAEMQKLLDGLYETTFSSDPIAYEQMSEQALRDQISAWLRPSYDQAVYTRGLRTGRANAELDADSIARGMGASSYVTDVKSRNLRDEAHDIALLESEYGATLAKNVSERLESEKARALEVDMFNREQEQADYKMAYDAAALLMSMGGRASGLDTSLRRRKDAEEETDTETGTASAATAASASKLPATSAKNCATFLARLTPSQRAGIYAGTDAQSIVYRNEIVASVGLDGFYQLQSRYQA